MRNPSISPVQISIDYSSPAVKNRRCQIWSKLVPYGRHRIADPNQWTLIFSKNSTAWGSFFYRPSEAVAEMQRQDLAVA